MWSTDFCNAKIFKTFLQNLGVGWQSRYFFSRGSLSWLLYILHTKSNKLNLWIRHWTLVNSEFWWPAGDTALLVVFCVQVWKLSWTVERLFQEEKGKNCCRMTLELDTGTVWNMIVMVYGTHPGAVVHENTSFWSICIAQIWIWIGICFCM